MSLLIQLQFIKDVNVNINIDSSVSYIIFIILDRKDNVISAKFNKEHKNLIWRFIDILLHEQCVFSTKEVYKLLKKTFCVI